MNTEITVNDLIFIIEEINGRESATVKGVVGDPLSVEIPRQVIVGDRAVLVEKIGERCFIGKSVKVIKLPDTINVLEESAFEHCRELEKISIPQTIKYIPARCFLSDRQLKIKDFPSSIVEVDTCGFQGVDFGHLNLSSNVKKVGWDAFKMCNLKSLHANEGLEQIGIGAFRLNPTLESVDLPTTVKIMESGVFRDCKDIKTFVIRAVVPPHIPEYTPEGEQEYFAPNVLDTMKLFVPKDSIELYRNHKIWGQIKNISPIVE